MKYSSNTDAVREHATQTAREWLGADPLFLDTETTGLNGHVIEIAALDRDGTPLLETLVQPRAPIEAGATALHGITQAMIADAPFFEQVWLRLRDLLRGRTVVVYNADFDRWRLIDSARDAGSTTFVETLAFASPRGLPADGSLDYPVWHCAMRGHVFGALHAERAAHYGRALVYADYYGEWNDPCGNYRWQTLENAARQCGLAFPAGIHRARADAELCRQVVLAVAQATQ